jgi:uncharacterized protein (TIGR02646 family)
MIALIRQRSAQAINAKYTGAQKKQSDRELLFARRDFLKDTSNPFAFNEPFWKNAKTQLKKESNGKCAYCEANTQVVAHGDVEHYRPKNTYWWLAYTYDNYLYACQICNQTYKSDNFPTGPKKFPKPTVSKTTTDEKLEKMAGNISPDPIDITQGYTLTRYLNAHKAEAAHLINPYTENPETYFAYEADDTTQEVKVVPANSQFALHAKAAEDFYGINRIELRNARYQSFAKFRAFKMALPLLPDGLVKTDVKKQIDDMLSDKYLFAGMNRFFNKKF